MKRVLRQTIVAVVITVVALELALQLASLFAEPLFARTSVSPGPPDAITILCVGDSHTYGAPLPEEESYPYQLQELLERRYPSREFGVVNLGLPGVNTGFVASRLKRQILEIRPHLVMVSAGRNDIWNLLHTDSGTGEESSWTALRRALLHVKLFRLAVVLTSEVHFEPPEHGHGRWQSSDQEQVKREIRNEFMRAKPFFGKNADTRVPLDRARTTIEQGMQQVVETTRSLGVPVIWYNYPQRDGRRRLASETIDAMGAQLGIPIVRSEEDVARAIADGHTEKELFVWAAGPHPTALMYGYIVESMVPQVAEALKKWYAIDLDAERNKAQQEAETGPTSSCLPAFLTGTLATVAQDPANMGLPRGNRHQASDDLEDQV
jgi:lysophospholipase L1-like esterase